MMLPTHVDGPLLVLEDTNLDFSILDRQTLIESEGMFLNARIWRIEIFSGLPVGS